MRLRIVIGIGVLLACAAWAMAQDLTPRPPAPTGTVVIRGATVHPVSGPPIENGAVAFTADRIVYVGEAARFDFARLPAGTVVIEGAGKRVYPGLFASSTVLGLTEISSVRATNDYAERGDFTPEVRANVAVNPDSTLIPVTRLGGVLMAGVFPSGGRVSGRVSVMRLEGWTWEDLTIDAEAGLAMSWPRMRTSHRWFDSGRPEERADAIAEGLRTLDGFFDAAEAYAQVTPAVERDERLEAMRPYVSGSDRSPIFIRADESDQIAAAVTWCAERGYRCVIVGGRDAEHCAEILKKFDVPVVLTGVHRFPRRADAAYDEAFHQPARLAALGIRFAIDTSDRDGNIRNLAHEAALARRHGLSHEETLRSITLTPAEIFGVEDRYGSLEVGKSPTMFVADGDILEVTTKVERVFIEGRDIPMRSKQTELRDKYIEKYRQLGLID
jgi:imidazolonepropionase-like amidohydrolase